MNEYQGGRFPLYHFDLYRLEGEDDLQSIGCEEYFFSNGVCLIEWAERVPENFFPQKNSQKNIYRVKINFNENENCREICVENFSD
jgi:tRNA threonylcarbamoyladenosine biosynthesis protein TsaE